ncbi:DUF4301 family protein [Carboxylicivirga sp. M1479]|uniref:DUF4301 family protein n=1 Tax=Carboxylicivirga sp. M1479 TaxID=2594476 RepID=UPI0011777B52|nr:DUF4301 family protein [Carboxylicivirga sp. M1479]TRX70420.1 DUF4301 family protein [Carboxylicivirga sp. M1479]
MLTNKDLTQLKTKGITESNIKEQLEHFAKGFAFANLQKAATLNDGILSISDTKKELLITKYKQAVNEGLKTLKFVPASGAATRMFKALFEFLQQSELEQAESLTKAPFLEFFKRINDFAFADDVPSIQNNKNNNSFNAQEARLIIEQILMDGGLNYGHLPKGLLKFHKSENGNTTPLEEHLTETAQYASNSTQGRVHFTVSPEHHKLFQQQLAGSIAEYESKHNIKYDVSFSFQKQSTDTIAVHPNNEAFRQENGELLFRPAGHGALIENLNDLDAELIFIKNIDNVVPEDQLEDTTYYKQLLAGILLAKKETVFTILHGIKSDNTKVVNEAIEQGMQFLSNELQLNTEELQSCSTVDKVEFISNKLNRPIRICGMVKNEGEPGGGPFWVKQSDGSSSLQIVEGAQIDPNNAEQQAILNASTHFNPVDLVCYIKDFEGKKFDLAKFVDANTGFISEKTRNGEALKALELPGLWNGAMAHWLTFFVEVPVSTFNPVKTIMDLLRPQHQRQ